METEREDDERIRQELVDYLAERVPDETVEHLEKIKSERVQWRRIDAWDVGTDAGRWWLLTSPTNVYSHEQFPSLEVAFSFHVGLMARVMERDERTAAQEDKDWFPQAWRKWEQAGEALHQAEEAEAYQAVGLHCRECLLALVREAARKFPSEQPELPKAGDFVGWTDLIGNAVAAGSSASRRRKYLKSVASSAWQLANWLTHAAGGTLMDAMLVHEAVAHVLTTWTYAILRFNLVGPDPCPNCSSYRVGLWGEPTGDGQRALYRVCRSCGWKSAPALLPEEEVAEPSEDRPPPDPDECVFVDVPLRGAPPPKPSKNK